MTAIVVKIKILALRPWIVTVVVIIRIDAFQTPVMAIVLIIEVICLFVQINIID